MLLEGKNAVIYGAGGAVGNAVARTVAREGAKLFREGRSLAGVDAVANDIAAAKAYGIISERFQNLIAERTHNRRLPTLRELAEVAAREASDRASAMEGTLVNMSLGAIPD